MNIAETIWKICEERDALRVERDELKQERDDLRAELCSVLGTCTAVVNDVRDESAAILAAFDAWGRSYWGEDGVRDMVGMNSATMAHNANQERLLTLWKQRHPEFFKKGGE
ncbi:MAG: hypothetical protein EHM42_11190 [Planctomycetaceae bacterium]|nr:MAG: hypothetical protein EHM42_11190 [Planctomycetaceae bacterium]